MSGLNEARPVRVPYGTSTDAFAELTVPVAGPGPWPVAVLLHGGYWRARHTLALMRPLAADLAARGFAAWNLEYRRGGAEGVAWRSTLADVAAGVDALAAAAAAGRWPLDLARVAFVGHSPAGSSPPGRRRAPKRRCAREWS